MIIVQNAIVSDDIADHLFACQLHSCHGACCIEGDSGAPLQPDEAETIRALLPLIAPYMTAKGREAVAEQGVSAIDREGDLGTALIDGGECAFVCYDEQDTALCAIERAYLDGKISFRKPISCHLYPIRITNYGSFQAVNYHRWDVCHCAVAESNPDRQPLYRYLREPLIRYFGQEWYDELLSQIAKQ